MMQKVNSEKEKHPEPLWMLQLNLSYTFEKLYFRENIMVLFKNHTQK